MPPDPNPPAPGSFRAWREDLERREFNYLLAREEPPRRDPWFRFFTTDDGAYLGLLDKAFQDPAWRSQKPLS